MRAYLTLVPKARTDHHLPDEPTLLEEDHCRERPTFHCAAQHPLAAWVQRPPCNGGGWVCGRCHPVYEKNIQVKTESEELIPR